MLTNLSVVNWSFFAVLMTLFIIFTLSTEHFDADHSLGHPPILIPTYYIHELE